jgi:uncharacterized protein
MMDYEGAKKYILNELKTKLKKSLYYHDLSHTMDVLDSALRLATSEKLPKTEITLLKTACIFHDAGMLNTYINHEEAACEIAARILPEYNYSPYEIETISKMIMATKLPQSASGKLEMIICDADLDYLGREDFFMISHKLKYEWEINQINTLSLKEWYELQVKFLESHTYFSETAIKTRLKGKEKNLAQIKQLICITE